MKSITRRTPPTLRALRRALQVCVAGVGCISLGAAVTQADDADYALLNGALEQIRTLDLTQPETLASALSAFQEDYARMREAAAQARALREKLPAQPNSDVLDPTAELPSALVFAQDSAASRVLTFLSTAAQQADDPRVFQALRDLADRATDQDLPITILSAFSTIDAVAWQRNASYAPVADWLLGHLTSHRETDPRWRTALQTLTVLAPIKPHHLETIIQIYRASADLSIQMQILEAVSPGTPSGFDFLTTEAQAHPDASVRAAAAARLQRYNYPSNKALAERIESFFQAHPTLRPPPPQRSTGPPDPPEPMGLAERRCQPVPNCRLLRNTASAPSPDGALSLGYYPDKWTPHNIPCSEEIADPDAKATVVVSLRNIPNNPVGVRVWMDADLLNGVGENCPPRPVKLDGGCFEPLKEGEGYQGDIEGGIPISRVPQCLEQSSTVPGGQTPAPPSPPPNLQASVRRNCLKYFVMTHRGRASNEPDTQHCKVGLQPWDAAMRVIVHADAPPDFPQVDLLIPADEDKDLIADATEPTIEELNVNGTKTKFDACCEKTFNDVSDGVRDGDVDHLKFVDPAQSEWQHRGARGAMVGDRLTAWQEGQRGFINAHGPMYVDPVSHAEVDVVQKVSEITVEGGNLGDVGAKQMFVMDTSRDRFVRSLHAQSGPVHNQTIWNRAGWQAVGLKKKQDDDWAWSQHRSVGSETVLALCGGVTYTAVDDTATEGYLGRHPHKGGVACVPVRDPQAGENPFDPARGNDKNVAVTIRRPGHEGFNSYEEAPRPNTREPTKVLGLPIFVNSPALREEIIALRSALPEFAEDLVVQNRAVHEVFHRVAWLIAGHTLTGHYVSRLQSPSSATPITAISEIRSLVQRWVYDPDFTRYYVFQRPPTSSSPTTYSYSIGFWMRAEAGRPLLLPSPSPIYLTRTLSLPDLAFLLFVPTRYLGRSTIRADLFHVILTEFTSSPNPLPMTHQIFHMAILMETTHAELSVDGLGGTFVDALHSVIAPREVRSLPEEYRWAIGFSDTTR